jgi:VWFA-related protein
MCFLLAVGFFCSPVFAQDPQREDEVIRVSTDLAVFPIRVRGRTGAALTGLTEQDFSWRDDDRVMTEPYFAGGAERVALVFALDESGSLRDIISQQRDAALALFGRFGGKSRIAVLRFADTPVVVKPFESKTEDAEAAFSFPARINKPTAIFDAAATALKTFEGTKPDPAERHIIILISDGLDTTSKTRPGTVIDAARAKGVSFYVIHLPLFTPSDGQLVVRTPAKGFRDLAEKTGGEYFLAGDRRMALARETTVDLTKVFSAIEEDLKSQYLVGFYVAEAAHDNRPHRVSITLKKPGAKYSVGQYGFATSHYFQINLSSGSRQNSQ